MKTLSVLTIISTVALAAFATGGESDVLKDRKQAMKALGTTMGVIAPVLKGGDMPDIKVLQGQAAVMHTSLVVIGQSFPEGSDSQDSEASPKIWEDPEGWAEKLGELNSAVDEFTAALEMEDQDMIKEAMGKYASTCKSCHEAYRIEKF